MSQPWSEAPGPGQASAGLVTLFDGSTFCMSRLNGDLSGEHTEGWYSRDTRIISTWLLRVDGLELSPVTVHQPEPFRALFLSRLPDLHIAGGASTFLIGRRRFLGENRGEQVTVWNNTSATITCTVTLHVGADLADVFEVKNGRVGPRAVRSGRPRAGALVITRRRGGNERGVVIDATGEPHIGPGVFEWLAQVPAHGHWSVTVGVGDLPETPLGSPHLPKPKEATPAPTPHAAPGITTGDRALAATLHRSMVDLGALRIFDPTRPGTAVVAAGSPWYMALFGRDALLTSWMTLPSTPALALGTLRALSGYQGTGVDHRSEEQPGRIPHEVRFGPAEPLGRGRRTVYYGSTDATPLFVMLVAEVARWAGKTAVAEFLPAVDRAMEWIAQYGDRDGDGFVESARLTGHGLVNQGWKDSPSAICFASGVPATPPIALAEVQGYTYAAYRARSTLAAAFGDQESKEMWAQRAAALKSAFNDRFWLADRGWFAVGLDRDKEPIDSLTSNIGHCLWTGIVDDDKAKNVAAALLSREMFTGWGVRTLASSMQAYNAMSYHTGSVWPHDTAICAAGLMKYGYVEEAQRIANGLLDAAEYFDGRLPELFCGYEREEFGIPVPYSAACSPQAWSAAAPLLLLRSMLRLDPDVPAGVVHCAPSVPSRFLPLHIDGVPVGATRLSVDATTDGWTVGGLDHSGLRVSRND